jgi:hypothetical protein
VTARSDGTVVAVGRQVTSKASTNLIMQNAASAPKTATTAAASTAPMATFLAVPGTPAGTTAAAPTNQMPDVLHDTLPADPLLGAAGKPLQSLSFIGHSPAMHKTITIWDLDSLLDQIGFFDGP